MGERDNCGLALTVLVAKGELEAPIVIGGYLDCGSVACLIARTDRCWMGRMRLRLAAVVALINTASGALWVSIHNGGGVGIGYSRHSGKCAVADVRKNGEADERCWTNDPGMVWQACGCGVSGGDCVCEGETVVKGANGEDLNKHGKLGWKKHELGAHSTDGCVLLRAKG